jgi:hypothetical protein
VYLGRGAELALMRGRRAMGQQEVHDLPVALSRCCPTVPCHFHLGQGPDSERALFRGSAG